jgi:zinc D-Ala-D-Ala carboxypeptidase
MDPRSARLLNAATIEAIPAALARARGNAAARRLAQGDWLVRRKSDGRFLAVRRGDTLHALRRDALPRRLDIELAELAANASAPPGTRPLDGLQRRLAALGLEAAGYAARTGLGLIAEPTLLAFAGHDRYRRPLWLAAAAARAWQRMRAAAGARGVALDAISGYRSHDYQLGIFRRKLARGQTLEQILAVNAAPGFSEHHGGCALDIGTAGEPPAEATFEATSAFAWLTSNAGDFGFVMSYPRDNPHGIVYEPWHWRWCRELPFFHRQ